MKSYKTKIYNKNNNIIVKHHNTDIIKHNIIDKTITLNNGGYSSKTTKDRMHEYLKDNSNYRLYQKDFKWYLDIIDNDKTIKTINYYNNIVLAI
tara:strand:+ start:2024 stop:2305 length:282 start_codon:yes stop_codon:yes gene_type:complete